MITLTNTKNSTVTMKTFLIMCLSLYKAKGLAKIFLIFLTASASVPFLETIQKFIVPRSLDNWVIFLILLILDVISGMYKHSGLWKKDEPNTLNKDEFFLKLFRKVFIGSVWLVLINVILNMDNSSDYFNSFGIGTIISWLGWSIALNLYVTSGSTFPPAWIMKKLKNANEGENNPNKK